ncbi:MAG TPA: dTDP-4-dehydrorhamnose 3,5-epimerase [Elusimicrobiota bacterium]|nr:dTDP-4-dehydrorhamnose 3,5-epimerase [Elusimicrobiota bacterium]
MIVTTPTPLEGLLILEPRVHRDPRGYFFEAYNERDFRETGLPTDFVQDNVSVSVKGTLRGLHFQRAPHAQGKLVRVLTGSVFDVAVDMRPSSPTFGKWFGLELSEENGRALYLPPGFAHGFLATAERVVFHYKVTSLYQPGTEGTLRWDDSTVGVQWPDQTGPILLSEKDRAGLSWKDALRLLSPK